MSIQIQKPPNESWDCMLPGPPSRNNGGSADISPAGLFAYASGSSVTIVETHSMQLVTTIPLPRPRLLQVVVVPTTYHLSSPPLSGPHNHSRMHLMFLSFISCLLLVIVKAGFVCSISGLDHRPDFSFSIPVRGVNSGFRICVGNGAPASTTFPRYIAKFAFSPHWRHLIFVVFPRDLVVFDLQYETALFSAGLPRGCGKFIEVLPDSNVEVLYCVHLDGKLSTWRRKDGEQVHTICAMEELMPSIGTPVPSPSILAAVISHSDAALQNIGELYSDARHSVDVDFDNPFDFCDESLVLAKTRLISISDDGKVWKWLLTAEGSLDIQKDMTNPDVAEACKTVPSEIPTGHYSEISTVPLSNDARSSRTCLLKSTTTLDEVSFKINLVGQLHLLSSAVTMLAVPSPSLTATLGRGGNSPAIAVPLVAVGTQSGTVDVIDVSANAVSVCFAVHNSVVRGLRWLGNSRLVSFSYSQGTEKAGGYINKLVVTCLRSGLNRPFRVLQKPERAPIRALRASSSGRSLALPFTVLEWTLPTVPRPLPKDRPGVPLGETSSPTKEAAAADAKGAGTDGSQDEFAESFSFALVNGALGVFEVHGRRIRDFRPKWPSSSFVSSEGLVTAMAYRLPHVVMGDRSGNIRWWDVTTGQSSSFNTHREGIRRIKFSPVVPGDRSRGRIAVLFYDNTYSVFDLDSPDPLANSLLQHQFPGTLVLELDWLPLRSDKNDPLVLCIAGADSSFRLVEVNISDNKMVHGPQARPVKERFRPVPLCSPILLPTPHALALRTILQLGVKPSWFNTWSTTTDDANYQVPGTPSAGDLRNHMIESPCIGDSVVPEMLLKVLEPYRREGCILNDEMVRLYASLVDKGSAVRFAFAAAIFGESMEALFWLQLPRALNYWMNSLANKSPTRVPQSTSTSELDEVSMLDRISSKGKSGSGTGKNNALGSGQLQLMAFGKEELWGRANEQIPWHEKLEGEEAIQNRVHELVSIGNLEAAVSLLLSTPPESSYFYANALRAVALSSAVSTSLLELAVKVVAANMVRTDRSLSGTHLLCAVGRHQEACSQLQDAGCWTDAATLAATHLKGTDYARVLLRWAQHVLHSEHNIWRALILYVAAGALPEALASLRGAQQPDTAAMFMLACQEIHSEYLSSLDDELGSSDKLVNLPGLNPESEDVHAVGEYYGQYQRKLVHLCMDSQPFSD
ncbi:unnamed protein product [Withania somnifera]